MRILMFNPNLKTRGGGEKVYLALASVLSELHEVTLFDRSGASLDDLAKYFNIDLSRVKIHTPKSHSIARIVERIPLSRLQIIVLTLINTRDIKRFQPDMFINNEHYSRLPAPIENSIYMCMFPQDLKKQDNNRQTILRKLYHATFDVLSHLIVRAGGPEAYAKIVANSAYTKKWIKKRWHKDSEILFPICEDMGPPLQKQHVILNVGRFNAPTRVVHEKRQDVLIEAFKNISETNPSYTLVLAGGSAPDPDSQQHIDRLHRAAHGYPIEFQHDASFADLKSMYQHADIYWHAAGYGVNQDESPEKMEHFGIVTAEAMSAGCIPIVFDGGGQPEIITDNRNGYLFHSKNELIQQTQNLIARDRKDKDRLRNNAINDAQHYQYKAFRQNVHRIFLDDTMK